MLSVTFLDTGQSLGEADDVALGDLDGDKDLDAVVVGQTANRVLFNDGFGKFTESEERLGETGGRPRWPKIKLADLNADRFLDVVIPARGIPVWWNDGSGHFDSGHSVRSITFDVGDFDADGDLDILTENFVVLNDGAGYFEGGPSWGTRVPPLKTGAVAVGDFNGDSHLDAFTGSSGGHGMWLNDGTGRLSPQGAVPMSARSARTVEVGDLDGDGDLDLIVDG